MSKVTGQDTKCTLYCSFCGKSQHEVRKLIAGPTVFICDECVELCKDIIREEAKSSRKTGGGTPTPTENYCGNTPLERIPDGTVLLEEGNNSGRLYVLAQGRVELLRGDTQITVLDEPGSLFGEMSVLLGVPHIATARTLGDATVHVIENGAAFFDSHPDLAWVVARQLANRLYATTARLVDLKRQIRVPTGP